MLRSSSELDKTKSLGGGRAGGEVLAVVPIK